MLFSLQANKIYIDSLSVVSIKLLIMYKKLSSENFYYNLAQREVILVVIFLVSLYSYALFHSIAEIISVAIGFGVYMVTWNSRRLIANQYFVFLGIAFFFVAAFDLLHAYTYQGIGIFSSFYNFNLSDHFWLAARFLQAFSFLIAAYFIGKGLKTMRIFYFYTFISCALVLIIIWWPTLPQTYLSGIGQTSFKVISEIFICSLLLISIFCLYKKSSAFNERVFKLLIWALTLSLLSEIMTLSYGGTANHASILSHIFKIASFNLIYMSFIETGLRKPYALLFKELKDSEMNLRRSEQKFRIIFDNATVGMLMTDLEGNIIESNQRFCTQSGYSHSELINLSLSKPNFLSHNVFSIPELQKISRGNLEHYNFENRYLKKGGQIMWGDTSVSLIKDELNEPQYLIWVIQDITITKEMDQVKTEFISLVSHQLRTHLTSVRLATELLLRHVGGQIDGKQSRYLNEIYDSTRLMTSMIRNLLNVSRVELDTLIVKPEIINLEKHIHEIYNELIRQIEAKNITYNCYCDKHLPQIFFDPQILRMIIENLLTNAINYTPSGGIINIRAEISDCIVLLSISDSGCGIADEDKAYVFTKLFRAKNAKEINPAGNGLGLYIVKAVTDKTGAEIWFESQEGIGTTFFLSLPLARAENLAHQEKLWQ